MNSLPLYLDFALRIVVLVLALTIGLFFFIWTAQSAFAASLRSHTTVTGDMFTVGDIFDGLPPETATHVLGPAPQPGQDMVLNTHTLMRIALAMDMTWRPQSSAEQIVIRRAATIIDQDAITKRISERLRQEGLSGNFSLDYSNAREQRIILPPEAQDDFEITTLDYNPQNHYFKVAVAAPSRENPIIRKTISGLVEPLVAVPVLSKTLRHGDIIRASAIDWVDMKAGDLQHDIILKAENLIGMTPRRMIEGRQLIRSRAVEKPQIVKRGDTVTITYRQGPISLTAEGRALENGAAGDLVRVVNSTSNRTIDATVTAEQTVNVSSQL